MVSVPVADTIAIPNIFQSKSLTPKEKEKTKHQIMIINNLTIVAHDSGDNKTYFLNDKTTFESNSVIKNVLLILHLVLSDEERIFCSKQERKKMGKQ